jgi:MoaA/NifB/PqqE/SkfB family radical SAM enzyme
MPSTRIGESGPFQKANRSAYVNFLRAKYEMYTGAKQVRSYPYYLTLEPSDNCQLRCPTCVTGIENETKRQKVADGPIFRSGRTMLSLEMFDALLEEMGDYLFLIVFYNFGEPLLNRNLPALIRRAKAYGIETDINTNLSLVLSDAQIDDVLSAGLDYMHASIDGFSQETYETHRVGGNFELVKRNLERFVAARARLGAKTAITFNFLVFSFNEHEVGDAARFCANLGINFNTREAFIHKPEWLPSYRKDEAPIPVPAAVALPSGFNYEQGKTVMQWSPLPHIEEAESVPRCAWHYGYAAMTAGGTVTPCCAVPKQEHDFGVFKPGQTPFSDVWNNNHFASSRAAFTGPEAASPTDIETVCTHCPVPRFIHHLYSLHDFKVIGQFDRVYKGVDPVLEEAFELFSLARYGSTAAGLFPGGVFEPPERLFGTENASPVHTAAFLRFFEAHLLAEPCNHSERPTAPLS